MVLRRRPAVSPALYTLTVDLATAYGLRDLLVRGRARARPPRVSSRPGRGAVAALTPQTAISTSTPIRHVSVTARASAHVGSSADLVHAGVHDVALLERRPQCAVQAVLQVELVLPLHHVGEQVTEERGVLVEQRASWRVSFVVTSSSSRTGRGGSAAQSRGPRSWSG